MTPLRLLFIFFWGPVIGVDLDLSFLSVLALKFNTSVEHIEL